MLKTTEDTIYDPATGLRYIHWPSGLRIESMGAGFHEITGAEAESLWTSLTAPLTAKIAPAPLPGSVTFRARPEDSKHYGLYDCMADDGKTYHSGDYVPAESVRALVEALTEIRDKRSSASFTTEQAGEVARAALAALGGAK